MSGSLKLIGQFSHDGIGRKTRVKFVISHRSMVAHSYHSKFAKDFAKKPKINRYLNENVKQKISNT